MPERAALLHVCNAKADVRALLFAVSKGIGAASNGMGKRTSVGAEWVTFRSRP
jgi:hypothetical protein